MKQKQAEEYIEYLNNKCEMIMKQKVKITSKELESEEIPTSSSVSLLIHKKYNAQQLKLFAKHYKLKVSGNKNELTTRIYYHLYFSRHATQIQRMFRGHLQRRYNNLHGPAFMKREICTNTNDFLSMEEMKELPYSQFISYKDDDGFVYGFDMISLYNLLIKSGKEEAKNPYNRNNIPADMLSKMKQLIRISKLLSIPMEIEMEDIQVSYQKAIELRILDLFQLIDSLGNYSNPEWFLSLNREELRKFMRELLDIWNYRAQISDEAKKNICPPYGDPFRGFSLHPLYNMQNIIQIHNYLLPYLEKLVKMGIDKDSKSLGAYYILGALTLVNENAALSLPWLFQSMSYV